MQGRADSFIDVTGYSRIISGVPAKPSALLDPEKAMPHDLSALGEAVTRIREAVDVSRGELARHFHVRVRTIAFLEENPCHAHAGLLEDALRLLVGMLTPNVQREAEVWIAVKTVINWRPELVPVLVCRTATLL